MAKKMFDNTIPVTLMTRVAGNAVMQQLDALQTDYIADNFNTTLGNILRKDTTAIVGNSENQMVHYPAHNLEQLNLVLRNNFYDYALHHVAFKDTPVLGQYKFPDIEDKNYNLFILGGDDSRMYVIYENYETDVIKLLMLSELPHVYKSKMVKVEKSPVKKVSDIWIYHYNEFMGFEVFE